MCYNYGHQPLVGGAYDQTQVYGDLAALKAAGVNCLRLAYYGYIYAPSVYTSGDTNPQKLAMMIESWEAQNNWHFSLIMGGDFDTISGSDFSAYDAAAVAFAQWAGAHNIEQVSLGNEQEYRLSGLSVSQWQQHLVELSSQVRAVYGGTISYETSGDFNWTQPSLGSIDRIGFNLYGGAQFNLNFLNAAIAQLGASHVYVSETNCDVVHVSTCQNSTGHAQEISGDAMQLLKVGVPVYFFAYRDGGNGTPTDVWAVMKTTGLDVPVAQVLGLAQ